MPQISLFHQKMLKVLRNACQSEIRLNLKQCLRFPLFHHKDAQSAPERLPEWNKTKFETMPQISTFSYMLKRLHLCCFTAIVKWGQTLIPRCSKCLKRLITEWNKTKFETMPQIVHFFITNMLKVLRNACKSEIRLNLKQCLRFPLFHHKDAQSA